MNPIAHFLATHCGGQITLCARLLGISRVTVYAYLAGRSPVPEQTLLAMAAIAAGLPPYEAPEAKAPEAQSL